jgi:hypothetical protein
MHDAGKKIKKRRINKKVKVTGRESRSDAQWLSWRRWYFRFFNSYGLLLCGPLVILFLFFLRFLICLCLF